MLTLQIKEKEIENLTPEEEFIRGTVGAKCQINFDEFWQGYEKYIVFKRVGYEPINIMVESLENEIEIPYTILAESGEFKIGVFGITETETLPTLYSKDIKILYGTDTHGTTPPTYTPSEIDQLRLLKQDKLVSGENIKTINNQSILGSGNITIEGGSGSSITIDQTFNPDSENAQSGKAVAEAVAKSGGGTTDYEQLENLPEINGVKLLRNKSLTDLGIDIPAKTSELENDSGFIDDAAFENYYTKTEVDEKMVVDQTYDKNSQNAQSGKAVAEAVAIVGGHYETVVEEIWQRNKIFTPVSFDYENQVITVSDGELDEYSIGDKIYCIIVPNISGCTLNSLSGRLDTKTLTVLSATELSVSNALHADTTVANFHFETVANYFLLAKNLSAKKIRVTVNGASSVPNNYYHPDVFYGINANKFYVDMVGYANNSLPLRSSMRLETEIISPYTIFNQFSIGYNCASSISNYHWKNNGAAWATGYMTKVPDKQYLFNGDGTKIENLWRTTAPWFCDENGQSQIKYNHPYINTVLHICNGTYIKIERWVE